MPFDLDSLSATLHSQSVRWAALGGSWKVRPVLPNYGKPQSGASLDADEWLVDLTVWATGEAELTALRRDATLSVAKHYDLVSLADLANLLDELAALITYGSLPPASVLW